LDGILDHVVYNQWCKLLITYFPLTLPAPLRLRQAVPLYKRSDASGCPNKFGERDKKRVRLPFSPTCWDARLAPLRLKEKGLGDEG
jgi:hypothetical protein